MSASQIVELVTDSSNLPIVIGIGATLLSALVLFFLLTRRKVVAKQTVMPEHVPTILADEKAAKWAPPEQSYADRRGALRREGRPVRVLLSSPIFRNGVTDGYVLDRSTGGLRVAMSTAIAPGSTMQIRAVHAPDTIGYVVIIVRSCRKNGDVYEVGCEFEQTPPWNVLLLFG